MDTCPRFQHGCILRRPHHIAVLAAALAVIISCQDNTGPRVPGITILAGGTGSDTIDIELVPIIVEVRGAGGALARGVAVTFTASRTDGSLTWPPPVLLSNKERAFFYDQRTVIDTTDRSGKAAVRVRTSAAAGDGIVTISVQGPELAATAHFTCRPGKPSALVLTPKDTPVVVGGSYQLHARLVDRRANPLPGTATFATSSGTIALSSTGVVSGGAVGRARIAAQIGPLTDSAFASVVPDAMMAVRDMGIFVGDSVTFGQVRLDGARYRTIAYLGPTPTEYSPSNFPSPQWLPGSGKVVYPRLVTGSPRLFVGDSTNTERRLIPASWAGLSEVNPEVTPDGAMVYFVAQLSDGSHSIWRVGTAGGTPVQITTTTEAWEFSTPSLSPDGSELAYMAAASGSSQATLTVRNLASGSVRQLPPIGAAAPRWSPTGEWILYSTYGAFSPTLNVIRPDGTGDHVLAAGGYFPGGSWSPDGKYVIVVYAFPASFELIDVATGTRLPLAYKRAWFGPAWRH